MDIGLWEPRTLLCYCTWHTSRLTTPSLLHWVPGAPWGSSGRAQHCTTQVGAPSSGLAGGGAPGGAGGPGGHRPETHTQDSEPHAGPGSCRREGSPPTVPSSRVVVQTTWAASHVNVSNTAFYNEPQPDRSIRASAWRPRRVASQSLLRVRVADQRRVIESTQPRRANSKAASDSTSWGGTRGCRCPETPPSPPSKPQNVSSSREENKAFEGPRRGLGQDSARPVPEGL